jgi:nitrite reductase/ring-hydroxylating ferredoxin subunit
MFVIVGDQLNLVQAVFIIVFVVVEGHKYGCKNDCMHLDIKYE